MAKRELTDSEQAAMEKAWDKHFNDEPRLSLYDSLEAGFIAALDTADAQIAENKTLVGQRDTLHEIAANIDANRVTLQAENTRLREALKSLLYIFDRGLPEDSIGRRRCDEARRELGEER